MGHITIPYTWKEFVFHRVCSSNNNSILGTGHIARGHERKEGRQTIFCTHLNPFGENPDEKEPSNDLSVPRKVHSRSNLKHVQDGFYWVNLSRAQDQGCAILADEI